MSDSSYDRRRQQKNESQQRVLNRNHEVGDLPKVVDQKLRRRMLESTEVFLREGFPDVFCDPFGPVQLSSIRHEERILETGIGSINKLEPRGFGKSVRSILQACRAALKGVQDFIMLGCDSKGKADDLLKIALEAFSDNEVLLGCFPELHCFHHLNRNPHRSKYQTYQGEPTRISIIGDTIRFPSLGGQFASEGALIVARPFKKMRGKNLENRRPSVVILDDIQTTEDAHSPSAPGKLVQILTTDIAFLGSRKKPVAIINNATVIASDDYPSRVSKLKAFTTIRYKMVDEFPANMKLWEEYQSIRQAYSDKSPEDRERAAREALEFYQSNREEMDKGSKVTWDYAFSPSRFEISTIQAAMNFIADFGMDAFNSECQNEPTEDIPELTMLSIDDIMAKTNNVPEERIPDDHGTVVGFVDVHEQILDYEVWSYDDNFGGQKVKGGAWPPQKRHTFNHARPPQPLSKMYPGMTDEARITKALTDLFEALLGREWKKENGDPLKIQRLLVDANGFYSDTIQKAVRRSKYAAVITPSFGMGITAKKIPISRLPHNRRKKNIGPEWAPKKQPKGSLPAVIFDANYWKTRFHRALAMPVEEKGSLVLHRGAGDKHRRSAEGYRAERPTKVMANGREIFEWSLKPNHHNHPLDCAVGCMVAASIAGVKAVKGPRKKGRRRRRVRQ